MAGYAYNSDYYECDSDVIEKYGIRYTVTSDLASEPVDTTFFKSHARIDFDTDDTLITSYLKAARQELESWGQVSFGVKEIRLTAYELPKNWTLMHGPVDTVTTTGYSNFGDILKEGGTEISVDYTTLGIINETIRIAICRYAAGLYMLRENVILNVNGTVQPIEYLDGAKKMIEPYINKPWF